MRNIISCDLRESELKVGVANAQCNTSCLYVDFIVPENIRLASFNEDVNVKVIFQDSRSHITTFSNLVSNEVEVQITYADYRIAGTITVSLYTSTYTSGDIIISIPNELTTNTDVLAKKDKSVTNKVILCQSIGSKNILVVDDIVGKNIFCGWELGYSIDANYGFVRKVDNAAISSDYIPVDFSTNPNYYLSGLSADLRTFVAAYNSERQFLKRTGANKVSYLSLTKNSFTSGYSQGTGDIAYLRVTTYRADTTSKPTSQILGYKTQLEIGNKATIYTPYKKYGYNPTDSMGDIVVDDIRCKNLFNINNLVFYSNNNATASVKGDTLTLVGNSFNWTNMTYQISNLKPYTTYTFSTNYTLSNNKTPIRVAIYYITSEGAFTLLAQSPQYTNSIGLFAFQFETNENATYYIRFWVNNSETVGANTVTYSEIQIEEGSIATKYTNYKKYDLSTYEIPVTISNGNTYQNDLLKNAKFVIVNWMPSDGSWSMQTIHVQNGYSLNTYASYSVGSVFNSTDGTIKHHYSTDTNMNIAKILIIK